MRDKKKCCVYVYSIDEEGEKVEEFRRCLQRGRGSVWLGRSIEVLVFEVGSERD